MVTGAFMSCWTALLHKSADGCDWRAEGGEPVQDGHANLKLCDLTVEVPGRQALTQQLDAVHLGLGAASAVIAAPSSPDGPPDTLRRAQDFVAGDSPTGVGFPRLGVLARRDYCGGTSGSDGVVALAGVESAIGGDGCDLLLGRDLVQQLGQHRGISHVAGRELGCTDFQGFLVDPDVDLAPDAPFRAAVLAGVPLALTLDLDPGAVDQQV